MTSEKRKVLVVEDDDALSSALKTALESQGYAVRCAGDGLTGRNIVSLETFDLVVSDIRMPHLSGIELLNFIKRVQGPPVILMTGFSEIAETKDAYEMGAKGFLAKPFKLAEFVALVKSSLSENEAELPSQDDVFDDNFIGMRIEEFNAGREIQYDIFIRLGENRFVKVAAGGESISADRIRTLKEKGLHFLHLRKSDFARYLGFAFEQSGKAADHRSQPAESNELQNFARESLASFYRPGLKRERCDAAAKLVENTLTVLLSQADVLALLSGVRQHSEPLFAHGLAVAYVSALIAYEVGWTSPRTVARLAACALLHDVGKKEISAELLIKPRIELTAGEIQVLETHCVQGKKLLEKIRGLPEEITAVAMQHHEDCISQGYPLRLSKSRISPLARLVAVANDFCNWHYPTPGHPALTPAASLQKLQIANAQFEEEYIKALRSIFAATVKSDAA